MRIALLDERTAAEPNLEGPLASSLQASVLRFRDLEEGKSSPDATEVDAVVVRCSPHTADAGVLLAEVRALWRDIPLIVVSATAANDTAVSDTRPRVEAWIAEGEGCTLQLAAAVGRALEQHLRRRQLEALSAIASEVNRSLDVIHILDAALDHVLRAVGTEAAGIYLLEGDPPAPRLRAWHGLPDEWASTSGGLEASDAFSDTILASGEPLVVEDMGAERPNCALVARGGFRFFAGVPLRAGGRTTGTLFVVSRSRPTQLELVPFLVTVGNQVGSAIENARLYQEAEAARRQWEATFNAIEDPVSIQDSDYTILRANRAFVRLMAHRGAAVVGAKCHELIHGLSAPPEDCAYQGLLRGERPRTMEIQPPDSQCQFLCSTYPRFDPKGHANGVVHVLRDVTEVRRLHDQVAQSDKLTAVGELLAGVAHELNNPLTTVGGLADLLQRNVHALPSEVRDDLGVIAEEAARATRIVQNLLAFSRQTPVVVEPVDLRDCLRRALEMFDYQFRVDNVRVEMDLPADLPWVSGECNRLEQVMVNLFSNARHALAEVGGGVLSVRGAAEGEMVRLEIADTGPGIPEEHLDHVFDPFFTTKAVGNGTGLGLSICRGIISKHGGRIEMANRPDGGALATVTLPCAPQPAQVAAPAEPAAAASAPPVRVLVVDDEPHLRRFVLRTLETAGHDAAAAGNAEEALDLLRREAFDVVLCDLKMPGAGGQGLYRTLLDEHAELAGRIIFCTGDTARPASQAFLDDAGAPCLTKPFTPQQLLDAVEHSREPQAEDTSP